MIIYIKIEITNILKNDKFLQLVNLTDYENVEGATLILNCVILHKRCKQSFLFHSIPYHLHQLV